MSECGDGDAPPRLSSFVTICLSLSAKSSTVGVGVCSSACIKSDASVACFRISSLKCCAMFMVEWRLCFVRVGEAGFAATVVAVAAVLAIAAAITRLVGTDA